MDTGAIVGNLVWIIFVGVVVVVTIYVQRKRHARLTQWAAHRGWTYHRSLNSLANRWRSPPFNTGRSRKATEVMTGMFHGEQALSFAYQYSTGDRKSQSTHRFQIGRASCRERGYSEEEASAYSEYNTHRADK